MKRGLEVSLPAANVLVLTTYTVPGGPPGQPAQSNGIRVLNPELNTYGTPPGYVFTFLDAGAVITDPVLIASLLAITSGQTSILPGVALPYWDAF
jgi:hypothetical protein